MLAPRPFARRPVPVQLEVVPVRIVEVDRLVCPVVDERADRPVGPLQPAERVGEVGARGVAQGNVVQARHAVGLRRPVLGLPGVEAEAVVVSAGRDEQDVAGRPPAGHVARLEDRVETKHSYVVLPAATDGRGAPLDVPVRQVRVDRLRGCLHRYNVTLRASGLGAHVVPPWSTPGVWTTPAVTSSIRAAARSRAGASKRYGVAFGMSCTGRSRSSEPPAALSA